MLLTPGGGGCVLQSAQSHSCSLSVVQPKTLKRHRGRPCKTPGSDGGGVAGPSVSLSVGQEKAMKRLRRSARKTPALLPDGGASDAGGVSPVQGPSISLPVEQPATQKRPRGRPRKNPDLLPGSDGGGVAGPSISLSVGQKKAVKRLRLRACKTPALLPDGGASDAGGVSPVQGPSVSLSVEQLETLKRPRGRPRKNRIILQAALGCRAVPCNVSRCRSSGHPKAVERARLRPLKRGRPCRTPLPSVAEQSVCTERTDKLWVGASHYVPIIPAFRNTVGLLVDVSNFTPVKFFGLFLTDTVLQAMATETNRYAAQYMDSHPDLLLHARARSWVPTDARELKLFWGLTFAMGLVKKPSIESYWNRPLLLSTPLFPALMRRNRYQILLKFLHVADNAASFPKAHPRHDPLSKVRPLIDHLSRCFQEVYTPRQNISVDESLLLYKGRLIFKQYIPLKRSRYGIKIFKLCESSTGYTYSFQVYAGKGGYQTDTPDCPACLNKCERIVWDLVYPLLNQGHHVYVDNYYTGIPLFQALYEKDTLACGTIRANRKAFPQELLRLRQTQGYASFLRCKELLAVLFSDRRDVFMLSTIHEDKTVEVAVRGQSATVSKPQCVLDYNRYMGGVDRSDQMLHSYDATRKSISWYKKLCIYLMQLSLHNSFVLYTEAAAPSSMSFLKFQMSVVTSLLFDNEEVQEAEKYENFVRLSERHFPRKVKSTTHKLNAQKRCRVCLRHGSRKDTRFCCESCPSKPGLCVVGCFEKYHTELVY